MFSHDGNVILCGGLLSLLKNQDDIFFFDISKPKKPSFISSTRAQLSSITDDPIPLFGGGYLVTMMGSDTGGTPGRVVEFDKNRQLVHEWPDSPPTDGFNPHGISVRPEANLMITSDFINPVTTLMAIQTAVVMVIYLDDAVRRRQAARGAKFSASDLLEAVREGARMRLRPKVMTVATTVAGLLPIVWSHEVGSEIIRPLAVPVLGGMLSSAIHILIVTPVLFAGLRVAQARNLAAGSKTKTCPYRLPK